MPENNGRLNKLITDCPICGGQLAVTHLRCRQCDSELSGTFIANEFARLPQDKLDFLRTFISCRGNLKEVEGALGISYPTVRSRLDQLIDALGMLSAGVETELTPADRAAVLAALERGELSVSEAESRLRG
jgi:hypothetical protein